jgi:hypothetical protein
VINEEERNGLKKMMLVVAGAPVALVRAVAREVFPGSMTSNKFNVA